MSNGAIPMNPHERISPVTSCGFYAMNEDEPVHGYRPFMGVPQGTWLLRVLLSGRVLRGRAGYRAEHQRVLTAQPFWGDRYSLWTSGIRAKYTDMMFSVEKGGILTDNGLEQHYSLEQLSAMMSVKFLSPQEVVRPYPFRGIA